MDGVLNANGAWVPVAMRRDEERITFSMNSEYGFFCVEWESVEDGYKVLRTFYNTDENYTIDDDSINSIADDWGVSAAYDVTSEIPYDIYSANEI